MNIFVNISHPAHVHLFKNAIFKLIEKGHKVVVGARKKEFTIDLLNSYKIDHILLTQKGKGVAGLLKELAIQQLKISRIIKKHSIDIMIQMNGIFNAPIGKYYGIPTLAFSDTENDKWANRISFNLSRHIFFPSCFDHSIGRTWKKQIHYPGYHELAYLSPTYSHEPIEYENKFLVRFVGWEAGHDIGEKGLSNSQKIELVDILKKFGSVYLSSEAPLPKALGEYKLPVESSAIHGFMKKCRMVVGESATMSSEAACLGIPALFISNTGRGYTTEQDKKYGLIKHYRLDQWDDIIRQLKKWASQDMKEEWQKKRWAMLKDKIEVTDWIVELIDNYPNSIDEANRGSFKRFLIKCVD